MLPFFISDEMGFSDEELLLMCAASGGKTVEDTATGNPLTFTTDIARPLKSLLIPFTPQQEGTGDPSPENIRPILPWNGLTVFGGGKNLFDIQHATFKKWRLDSNNFVIIAKGSYADGQIDFTVGADNVTVTTRQNYFGVGFLLEACDFKRVVSSSGNVTEIRLYESYENNATMIKAGRTCVIPANTSCFVGFLLGTAGTYSINIQLEVGQTATTYEEYKFITEHETAFPSPCYGGQLDVVSGVLTVEYGFITLDDSVSVALANWRPSDGTSAWLYSLSAIPSDTASNSAICDKVKQNSYGSIYGGSVGVATNVISGDFGLAIRVPVENLTTEEAIHAYLAENPYHVAYKLATPQEIQLTPAQITALLGQNTIWSDADGSMTAVYLKKG